MNNKVYLKTIVEQSCRKRGIKITQRYSLDSTSFHILSLSFLTFHKFISLSHRDCYSTYIQSYLSRFTFAYVIRFDT